MLERHISHYERVMADITEGNRSMRNYVERRMGHYDVLLSQTIDAIQVLQQKVDYMQSTLSSYDEDDDSSEEETSSDESDTSSDEDV